MGHPIQEASGNDTEDLAKSLAMVKQLLSTISRSRRTACILQHFDTHAISRSELPERDAALWGTSWMESYIAGLFHLY